MKHIINITIFVFVFQFCGFCQFGISLPKTAKTETLSLDEINPVFSPIESAFDDNDIEIEYIKIGDSAFDDFFYKSAQVNGLITVSNIFLNNTTISLKNTAMDIMASNTIDVKGVVGDKPDSEWTSTEYVAVIKLANKKKEIDDDVTKDYLKTGANLLLVAGAISESVTKIPDLITSGTSLTSSVSGLSPTLIPSAGKGLTKSLDNLKGIVSEAPDVIKNLTVLAQAIKMFVEN